MGRLYLRLAGANAAVAQALESGRRELEPQAAAAWWSIFVITARILSSQRCQLEGGECSWRLRAGQRAADCLPESSSSNGAAANDGGEARPASQINRGRTSGGHATLVRARQIARAFTTSSSVDENTQALEAVLRPRRHFNQAPLPGAVTDPMQTKLSPIQELTGRKDAESILRSCVHCGFCNATCPTTRFSATSWTAPRRIYLIKECWKRRGRRAPSSTWTAV